MSAATLDVPRYAPLPDSKLIRDRCCDCGCPMRINRTDRDRRNACVACRRLDRKR